MYPERTKKTTMVDDKQCTYMIYLPVHIKLYMSKKKIGTDITSRLSRFYLEVDEN